jgi:spermidine synthase
MGLTLPLLARALVSTTHASGSILGSLWGWNTLGAAGGALVSTWVILPLTGLPGPILAAAALNTCAAAIASRLTPTADGTTAREPSAAPNPAAPGGLPVTTWLMAVALAGVVALTLELAWFRVLAVATKSTTFTFGTMLAVYLGGLGVGAASASRLVRRWSNPGSVFLLLQVLTVAVAAASLIGLVALLETGEPDVLRGHLVSGDGDERLPVVILVDLLLPIALLAPSTLLMGAAWPFLQQAVHVDLRLLGRRFGGVLAADIAGSLAGALLAGIWLLPRVGASGTFTVVVLLGVVPAILWWRTGDRRRRATAGIAIVASLALLAAAVPSRDRLWAALHGVSAERMVIEEGVTGVTALLADGTTFGDRVMVFANGLSQSWIPFGDVHTALGALPALIHPNPVHVAVIGLGSGDTAFAAGARATTSRITAIEIMASQRRALMRLAGVTPFPALIAFLQDPRVDHVVADGRAHLLRTRERFDIIEADALRPQSAYSGNLNSLEYFVLLRSRLKPGGFAVTWASTDRVAQTLLEVFPYVLRLGAVHIGSDTPVPFDRALLDERLRDGYFASYFADVGMDVLDLLTPFLDEAELLGPEAPRIAVDDLNTDMFPRDEFTLPHLRAY